MAILLASNPDNPAAGMLFIVLLLFACAACLLVGIGLGSRGAVPRPEHARLQQQYHTALTRKMSYKSLAEDLQNAGDNVIHLVEYINIQRPSDDLRRVRRLLSAFDMLRQRNECLHRETVDIGDHCAVKDDADA